MGIPQAPGQPKQASTFGLRAVFAGIGRLLLLADRPEARLTDTDSGPGGGAESQYRRAGRRPARAGRGAATESTSRWRSLDKTGNVRLLSAEDLDEEFDDGELLDDQFLTDGALPDTAILVTALPDIALPGAELADVEPPQQLADVELPEVKLADAALPLANYDELSLASIRARLRSLDATQLRILADYERRNAERPDVLGMLERRIEKLGAGG